MECYLWPIREADNFYKIVLLIIWLFDVHFAIQGFKIADRDKWRESQRDACCRYILMKMIYIYIFIQLPLSRRFTMHLSDTSSIAQHLKNIHVQQQNYGKFLRKTQQHENNKITSKNYRFSRHYILGTYNLKFIESILKPVLMYLNVFSNWRYL